MERLKRYFTALGKLVWMFGFSPAIVGKLVSVFCAKTKEKLKIDKSSKKKINLVFFVPLFILRTKLHCFYYNIIIK